MECAAQGNEFFEGSVDTVALDVAVKKTPDLILRQSAAGGLDGFADTVGDLDCTSLNLVECPLPSSLIKKVNELMQG